MSEPDGFVPLHVVLRAPSDASSPVSGAAPSSPSSSMSASLPPLPSSPTERAPQASVHGSAPASPATVPESVLTTTSPQPTNATSEKHRAAVRDATLFSARIADAFECVRERLLTECVQTIVARELLLAPVDVARVVADLVEAHGQPMRVRLAPDDRDVACEFPVVIDPNLKHGDAILELQSGIIDARLAVRVADLVSRLT